MKIFLRGQSFKLWPEQFGVVVLKRSGAAGFPIVPERFCVAMLTTIEPCINNAPLRRLRRRVGAPAFKPGIRLKRLKMTLGFSPGVWKLGHLLCSHQIKPVLLNAYPPALKGRGSHRAPQAAQWGTLR